MVIHAGVQAGLFVAGHGIGGNTDDRGMPAPTFIFAHQADSFFAAHHGHVHIHEHDVPGLLLKEPQAFFAVCSECDPVAPFFQQSATQALVNHVVFDQQDLQ